MKVRLPSLITTIQALEPGDKCLIDKKIAIMTDGGAPHGRSTLVEASTGKVLVADNDTKVTRQVENVKLDDLDYADIFVLGDNFYVKVPQTMSMTSVNKIRAVNLVTRSEVLFERGTLVGEIKEIQLFLKEQ